MGSAPHLLAQQFEEEGCGATRAAQGTRCVVLAAQIAYEHLLRQMPGTSVQPGTRVRRGRRRLLRRPLYQAFPHLSEPIDDYYRRVR